MNRHNLQGSTVVSRGTTHPLAPAVSGGEAVLEAELELENTNLALVLPRTDTIYCFSPPGEGKNPVLALFLSPLPRGEMSSLTAHAQPAPSVPPSVITLCMTLLYSHLLIPHLAPGTLLTLKSPRFINAFQDTFALPQPAPFKQFPMGDLQLSEEAEGSLFSACSLPAPGPAGCCSEI